MGENPTEENKIKYSQMLEDGLLENQLIKMEKNPESVQKLIGIKFVMLGNNTNPIGILDPKGDDVGIFSFFETNSNFFD